MSERTQLLSVSHQLWLRRLHHPPTYHSHIPDFHHVTRIMPGNPTNDLVGTFLAHDLKNAERQYRGISYLYGDDNRSLSTMLPCEAAGSESTRTPTKSLFTDPSFFPYRLPSILVQCQWRLDREISTFLSFDLLFRFSLLLPILGLPTSFSHQFLFVFARESDLVKTPTAILLAASLLGTSALILKTFWHRCVRCPSNIWFLRETW